MRDGTVTVSAPGITDEKVSAPLPDIHLTDIGADGNGATPAEVASQTMTAVIASAKQAVKLGAFDYLAKPVGPDEVVKAANDAIVQKQWTLRSNHSH